jgi:hypothetical protein
MHVVYICPTLDCQIVDVHNLIDFAYVLFGIDPTLCIYALAQATICAIAIDHRVVF